MSEEPLPLARPVLGPAEEAAVVDVLRSGRLSIGPEVERFEQAIAARLGDNVHCSAVSSGTAALHLALRAVGVGEGAEVITTPFSFVASANTIVYERAKPVFADIDPVTLNVDPDAVAAAVTDRTTALLPVHIFGYPADLAALERLELPIVEDACEALGAEKPEGTHVGATGHPAAFAFYPNKQITTGEGGILALPTAEMKARVDSERNQGRAPDMDWLDHDRLGFNYRLSDIACAIGTAQLARLDELLARRAELARLYSDALAGIDGLGLPCPDRDGAVRSWFVYVVQVPDGADRDSVIQALGQRGIESKPYLPAIHLMTFYRERFGYREGQFPVCERVAAGSLALPFFPTMADSDVERVAVALKEALGR